MGKKKEKKSKDKKKKKEDKEKKKKKSSKEHKHSSETVPAPDAKNSNQQQDDKITKDASPPKALADKLEASSGIIANGANQNNQKTHTPPPPT